jgi:hypothetical protein
MADRGHTGRDLHTVAIDVGRRTAPGIAYHIGIAVLLVV